MTLFSAKTLSVEWWGKLTGMAWGMNRRWGSEGTAQTTLLINPTIRRRDNHIWRGTGIGSWKGVSLTLLTLSTWWWGEGLRRLMGRNCWRGAYLRNREKEIIKRLLSLREGMGWEMEHMENQPVSLHIWLQQAGGCADFYLLHEVGGKIVCWEWVVRKEVQGEWRFRSASGENKDCWAGKQEELLSSMEAAQLRRRSQALLCEMRKWMQP